MGAGFIEKGAYYSLAKVQQFTTARKRIKMLKITYVYCRTVHASTGITSPNACEYCMRNRFGCEGKGGGLIHFLLQKGRVYLKVMALYRI